jgi:lysophospholipase L1-like esterase
VRAMSKRSAARLRLNVELLEHRDMPAAMVANLSRSVVPAPLTNSREVALHARFVDVAQHRHIGVLFLGDSITARWLTHGQATWDVDFVPLGAAEFGIAGDTAQNILWRVQHGELSGPAPRAIVLLAGTNNLKRESPAAIATEIAAILQTIHAAAPTSKVLLLGILPRGGPGDGALRRRIVATNHLLAHLADGHAVRFLDAGEPFLSATTGVRTSLMPDGLHPSAAGYQVLGNLINPVLRRMLASHASAAEATAPRTELHR